MTVMMVGRNNLEVTRGSPANYFAQNNFAQLKAAVWTDHCQEFKGSYRMPKDKKEPLDVKRGH